MALHTDRYTRAFSRGKVSRDTEEAVQVSAVPLLGYCIECGHERQLRLNHDKVDREFDCAPKLSQRVVTEMAVVGTDIEEQEPMKRLAEIRQKKEKEKLKKGQSNFLHKKAEKTRDFEKNNI